MNSSCNNVLQRDDDNRQTGVIAPCEWRRLRHAGQSIREIKRNRLEKGAVQRYVEWKRSEAPGSWDYSCGYRTSAV